MALDIGHRGLQPGGPPSPRRGPPDAHRGHRRRRSVRSGHRHPARPGRRPELHRHRAVRRRGRHLAGQRLPGRGLRRAVPPLLLLLRPEDRLVPPVRRTARDPLLRRGPGRPLPPGAPPPSRHHGAGGPLRRGARAPGTSTSTPGRAARCSRPTPWSSPAASSTDPTARRRGCRHLRRAVVALGTVGPHRRPDGQAGGRGRHRGQRHPVRARRWPRRRPAPPSSSAAPTTWARRRTTRTRPAPAAPCGGVAAAATAYRWWIYWTLEMRWLWFRRDGFAGRQLQSMFRKGIRGRGRERPAARARRGARLPARVQADPDLQRLVPGPAPARRDRRRLAGGPGRARRRGHRGRRPGTRPTSSSTAPDSSPPNSCPTSR